MRDLAVVVGISRYPQLAADGAAPDLDGPHNDALAVKSWLVDPDGGALAEDDVRLIRSDDPVDAHDPEPATAQVERALKWVEEQTRESSGRRLYLYFSGHGFAPRLEEGALFTANASQMSPEHVFAHGWMQWFRTAQRFREVVLWMDCCMNFSQSIPVNEVPLRTRIGTGSAVPAFLGLAAQTKSALEHRMDDGQVHGVFTWTLLRGLQGGAADERGRVTGHSLRNFLLTVMPEFLPDSARNSTAVDLYPFVRADDGLVFHRLPARLKYPVQLTFPAEAEGEPLHIWTGRPLVEAVSATVRNGSWSGELLRGLYVAEVPGAGLRHGFQVSGAGRVPETVSDTGPAVGQSDGTELFSLDVVADNPSAAISVMDNGFERVFDGTGEVHEVDSPGVYKVRVEFGRDITMVCDQVVLLDRHGVPGRVKSPQLASAAPIPGTASTLGTHETPFADAAEGRSRHTPFVHGSSGISLLARHWSDPGQSAIAVPHPMAGLELVDAAGVPLGDLVAECDVDGQPGVDAVAVWERPLDPGVYFLRQSRDDGRRHEGCLVVSPGWITQVAVKRAAHETPSAEHPDGLAGVALFMRRHGVPRSADEDAAVEGARVALALNRNILAEGHGEQLVDMLVTNVTSPIAGIIGGHLLLLAMKQAAAPNPQQEKQFDTLVRRLRELVGDAHPDVEALSLRCTDPTLRTTATFIAPPMLRYGWQLVTDASYDHPELISAALWERVHATVALRAYLTWAIDGQTQQAHADQLSAWMGAFTTASRPAPAPGNGHIGAMAARLPVLPPAESLPSAARDAARRLQVPAVAAEALWRSARRTAASSSPSPAPR
ncbi:caspase family protein [Mycobacterium sp. NPDC050041]|uniref:caspase family protein n=1 Tax=Mycobacterium sp. NPDC050041 TaxID=3364293 RepID=UPI003C2B8542